MTTSFDMSAARVTRRRLLAGLGSTSGLLALSIIGCGSGDSDSGSQVDSGATGASSGATGATSSGGDPSGLLTTLQDTTSQARAGGVWPAYLEAEPSGFDERTVVANSPVGFIASRLFKAKPGILEAANGEMEGDIIESWEYADEGTTLVMKLNRAAKWDPRAPTNGRAVDAEDVLSNWQTYSTGHVARAELNHEISPFGPIESMTSPDAETIVVKLAFPFATLLRRLGDQVWMYPKEAVTDSYDARTTPRGSGAWRLEEWNPSVSLTFSRNPDWHGAQKPFTDRAQVHIIPEYTQRLAQFRARNLMGGVALTEDILITKRDLPELVMYGQPISRAGSRNLWHFGMGGETGAYFADERVRQAFSMLHDRETFLDAFANVKEFEDAGITVSRRYHGSLYAGEAEWIDPFGNEIGEGGKFFQHNPEEAAKLLSAAGFSSSIEVVANHLTNAYPAVFHRQFEVTIGELRDGGITVTQKDRDYAGDYLPNVYYSKGEYEGIGFQGASAYPDAAEFVFGVYHPEGARAVMQRGADPAMEEDILAIRRELDTDTRTSLLKDFQRYMAVKQWAIMFTAGVTTAFELQWPEAGNAGVYQAFYDQNGFTGKSWPSEILPYYWIDESKRS